MEEQVKSRHRVTEYGEVLTGKREVNAMLDLVKQETERIDSRFLEPACGTGNFLSVILERKLDVVEKRYGKSQLEFERYSVLAVSSIYGIDILEDNVIHCRQRLLGLFELVYLRLFKNKTNDNCRETIRFILDHNIIWGDALYLTRKDDPSKPVVFSEWSPFNGSFLIRRDFTFAEILSKASLADEKENSIFNKEETRIPPPIKVYPPCHFMELANVQD